VYSGLAEGAISMGLVFYEGTYLITRQFQWVSGNLEGRMLYRRTGFDTTVAYIRLP
jgi:hypothetical protein